MHPKHVPVPVEALAGVLNYPIRTCCPTDWPLRARPSRGDAPNFSVQRHL